MPRSCPAMSSHHLQVRAWLDIAYSYLCIVPTSRWESRAKSPRSSSGKDSPKTRTRTRGKRSIEDGAGKDGPLKKSFEKTQDVGKAEQAWFVTYLKGTAAGKDELASNKANDMLMRYRSSSNVDKKLMVCQFFRQGGKKQGLNAIVQQTISLKEKANKLSWKGYATVGKLLTLNEALFS